MYLISFSSMIFVLINVIHSRQKYLDLELWLCCIKDLEFP